MTSKLGNKCCVCGTIKQLPLHFSYDNKGNIDCLCHGCYMNLGKFFGKGGDNNGGNIRPVDKAD